MRGGSCFGFDVDTDVPLRFLRAGPGGAGRLRVTVRDAAPRPRDLTPVAHWGGCRGEPASSLHAEGDRFWLWAEDDGWYRIDPSSGEIAIPSGIESVRREERLWGLPALLLILARGDLPLHAAAIEMDGAAVLIAAGSGRGKSTLAAACSAAGHRVLAEDVACVHAGARPTVYPGPGMVRMRSDVVEHVVPAGEWIELADGRRRVILRDRAPKERAGSPVPLAAIVLLDEGAELAVAPSTPVETIRALWRLGFVHAGRDDAGRLFSDVADLVAETPAFRLQRPTTIAGLPYVIERLASLARARA